MEIKIGNIETENGSFKYSSFGSGKKTMVVIPGMSPLPLIDSAEQVAEGFKAFCEDYTVYVFECRKRSLEGNITIFHIAYELSCAFKELGISKAYVLGISYGGMIAECLAVKYPELVKKLAAVSSLSRQNTVSYETFSEWSTLAKSDDKGKFLRSVFSKVYSPEFYENSLTALEQIESACTDDNMKEYAVMCEMSRKYDIYGELPKIECPTLVIGASDDRVLSVKGSKETAKQLGCELVIFDGAHAIYDENPECYAKVKQFFGA